MPNSLLTSTLPPHLVQMHTYTHHAGRLLMRIGAFPLLLAELNQNGLSRPEDFSMLLQHFLQLPLKEIRLTLLSSHESLVEIWQFDELEGLLRQSREINRSLFDEYCGKPLHIPAFGDPELLPIQHVATQIFGSDCRSFVNVPLSSQGRLVGVFHCARSEPEGYNEADFFVAQLLGQSLVGVLLQEQLKARQSSLEQGAQEIEKAQAEASQARAELLQLKQLFESTKEAYEKAQVESQQLDAERQERKSLELQLHEALEECARLKKNLDIALKTRNLAAKSSQSHSQTALPASPEQQSAEYVASPPPIASSKPKRAPLDLPPVDALRSAFRPQKPEEIVLLEVVDDVSSRPQAPSADIHLDLDEFEIEQVIDPKATPTLLCLTAPPSDSLRSFARIIQSFDFMLEASPTIPELFVKHELLSSSAIALTTQQLEQNPDIFSTLAQYPTSEQIPLFEANDDGAPERAIRLHWSGHSSKFIADTFWHNWLRKTRNPPETQTTILSIGARQMPMGIIDFFCGKSMEILSFENPVDGIQAIYQTPPRLLVLDLGAEQGHWPALFNELSRSARTLETPLLLLSQTRPDDALWEVIQLFTFLFLGGATAERRA